MRDEHLDYVDMADGKIRITPEDGYKMICTLTQAEVSEAIAEARATRCFTSRRQEGDGNDD